MLSGKGFPGPGSGTAKPRVLGYPALPGTAGCQRPSDRQFLFFSGYLRKYSFFLFLEFFFVKTRFWTFFLPFLPLQLCKQLYINERIKLSQVYVTQKQDLHYFLCSSQKEPETCCLPPIACERINVWNRDKLSSCKIVKFAMDSFWFKSKIAKFYVVTDAATFMQLDRFQVFVSSPEYETSFCGLLVTLLSSRYFCRLLRKKIRVHYTFSITCLYFSKQSFLSQDLPDTYV